MCPTQKKVFVTPYKNSIEICNYSVDKPQKYNLLPPTELSQFDINQSIEAYWLRICLNWVRSASCFVNSLIILLLFFRG